MSQKLLAQSQALLLLGEHLLVLETDWQGPFLEPLHRIDRNRLLLFIADFLDAGVLLIDQERLWGSQLVRYCNDVGDVVFRNAVLQIRMRSIHGAASRLYHARLTH